jgi:hypothetical protein
MKSCSEDTCEKNIPFSYVLICSKKTFLYTDSLLIVSSIIFGFTEKKFL